MDSTKDVFDLWLERNPIRVALEAMGHDIYWLALRVGVSATSVLRWTQGTKPTTHRAHGLALALNMPDIYDRLEKWQNERPKLE